MVRHSGIPTGHRHCARNRSLPIACRSSAGRSFSHSRTGSLPVSVRKKIRGFSSAEAHPPSCTVHSTLYLKMCRPRLRLIEIGNEVFHCQLGFTDHSAPRALDEPLITFFGARYGLRSRVGGRFRHAGKQSLRQSIDVGEQSLLCPRNAKHILSHLVQGGGYAFTTGGWTRNFPGSPQLLLHARIA